MKNTVDLYGGQTELERADIKLYIRNIFFYMFTGCFIKRQKIPLPDGNQDTGPYYKIRDLVIGESVIFFGKKIMITGANEYTRDFLQKMGLVIKDNEEIPPNPYFEYRKKVKYFFFF